jgi:DNA-binding response OmpR family regulator
MVKQSLKSFSFESKLNEKENNYQKHALLIEDNITYQKVMKCYLSNLGYRVEIVNTANLAIQKIRSKTFDLMITDIGLPDGPGTDVIRAARQYELNLASPLLVWSAHINNDEEKYLNLGADAILDKACSAKELEEAIQECYLITGYERKFNFKLNRLGEKFRDLIAAKSELEVMDYSPRFRSFFCEALSIIEEHMSKL